MAAVRARAGGNHQAAPGAEAQCGEQPQRCEDAPSGKVDKPRRSAPDVGVTLVRPVPPAVEEWRPAGDLVFPMPPQAGWKRAFPGRHDHSDAAGLKAKSDPGNPVGSETRWPANRGHQRQSQHQHGEHGARPAQRGQNSKQRSPHGLRAYRNEIAHHSASVHGSSRRAGVPGPAGSSSPGRIGWGSDLLAVCHCGGAEGR